MKSYAKMLMRVRSLHDAPGRGSSAGACGMHVVVVGVARGGRPARAPRRRGRSVRRGRPPPGSPAARSGPSSCATSSTVPPPATKVAQRAGERRLAGGVDAGGRLVEDQQLRLGGQGPGDQRALLLAAGERRHRVARPDRRGRPRRARRRPRPGRCARTGRSSPRRASRPEATTSATVAGTPLPAPSRCGTYPIRRHCRRRPAAAAPRSPEQATPCRRSAAPGPRMARIRVDLPEPLAPRMATTSPGGHGQVDAAQDGSLVVADLGPAGRRPRCVT